MGLGRAFQSRRLGARRGDAHHTIEPTDDQAARLICRRALAILPFLPALPAVPIRLLIPGNHSLNAAVDVGGGSGGSGGGGGRSARTCFHSIHTAVSAAFRRGGAWWRGTAGQRGSVPVEQGDQRDCVRFLAGWWGEAVAGW